MIGILIITHESLGDAYRSLSQHFFNHVPENIKILGIQHDQNHEDIIAKAQDISRHLNRGHGVLIITDIFGATPCNAARKLVCAGKVAMLTGLNAPMLIKAIQYAPSATDLNAFIQSVKTAAIEGILDITTPPDDN